MMQTLRVFRSWGEGGVYFHGLHVNLQIMEKQGENSSKTAYFEDNHGYKRVIITVSVRLPSFTGYTP